MLSYLSLDICSSKLAVFLELRSRKTVRFSEQIMSADKYPGIVSLQMVAIFYLVYTTQMSSTVRARWLASSEVISQVTFTSEQPKKKKAFVGTSSQTELGQKRF